MFSFFNENLTVQETLKAYLNRKLSFLGNMEYAYTVVSKSNPSDLLIISSYNEEWVSLYRANNLQLIDPVILTAFRQTSPFAWDENITLMSDLKFSKIFFLSRQYKIVNGFTFVLHDHMNNLALLSVIISYGDPLALEKQLSNEQGEMQMLLIDVNEQMYRLADAQTGDSHHSNKAKSKAIFSLRENEVLFWASMGKTYGEIAAIAGISVSTVKFHMRNVTTKLGVNNARQAIRLGVELSLIKPAASAAR